MPSSVFSPLEREQLDGFPPEIRAEELSVYFRLSLADLFEIRDLRGPTNQFGFALQICALRFLGFSPRRIAQAPLMARLYVAEQLGIELAQVSDYVREQTRTEHAARAQTYLGFRPFSEEYKQALAEWLIERALEHDDPRTLMELTLQKLKAEKVVRPGISVFERMVFTARERAGERTYKLLLPQLTPARREFLDGLLKRFTRPRPRSASAKNASTPDPAQSQGNGTTDPAATATATSLPQAVEPGQSRLEWLRQEPVYNSPAAILDVLARRDFLQEAGVADWKFEELNPNRRRWLAAIAKRSSVQALSSGPAARRYPALAVFASETLVELTDLALEMFDAYMSGVDNRARRELQDFRLGIASAANEKMHYFSQLGQVVLDEGVNDTELREAIYARLPQDKLRQAVADCAKLTRPLDDSYFDLLGERYSHIREFAPQWLAAFEWQSNLAARPLLEGIELLKRMNREKLRNVPAHAPEAFISSRWRGYVYEENGTLNRKYFELCILWEMRQALRGGNLWVAGARRYAPVSKQLIEAARWEEVKAPTCALLNLPTDGAERIRLLETEIGATLGRLEKLLTEPLTDSAAASGSAPANKPAAQSKKGSASVRLEEGKLVGSRLEAVELPASTRRLRQLVGQKLPRVQLVDLIMEVDRWTNFSQTLTHAGNNKPCDEAQRLELYAALVAQGCNLGLSTMSRMSGYSEGGLRWLTNWHIREETLKAAVTRLVNYQHAQPLAAHWGTGGFSSSDGQRFVVAVPSRSRAALPRYFGYGQGLTIMSWTADQYIQFATRTARTTNREALYTLDGILNNKSELPLKEHTTDTHGYTELVFALFDLLDMKFSPRLRDLSDQRLWRTPGMDIPPLFEEVFKNHLVQSERVTEQWDELTRLAGSLKLGHTSASLIIGKLQASALQNSLTSGLQHYGRLVKTEFILRYLESEEYRRRINAQLDKGENIHALRDYLFWGNKGQLRKRGGQELLDQSWCLNLLVNCILVWNTVYMQLALSTLRREGISFEEAELSRLAPSRYRHINVFGRYDFEGGWEAVAGLGSGHRLLPLVEDVSVQEAVAMGSGVLDSFAEVEE